MTATTSDTLVTCDLLAMQQWSQAQERIVTSLTNNTVVPLHGSEAYQWEQDWIRCARELGQWAVLKEYGQNREDPHTLLDAAWKL
jgi:transformation/transcription domain-associated protein